MDFSISEDHRAIREGVNAVVRRFDDEYWLARDLQHLLGYTKWDNFLNVVHKAKTACEVSGHQVPDHFADVGKTIAMPKGAEKEAPDLMLKPNAFEDWKVCVPTGLACSPGIEPSAMRVPGASRVRPSP